MSVEEDLIEAEEVVEEEPTLTITIEIFENQKPHYTFLLADGKDVWARQVIMGKRGLERAYREFQREQRRES